MQHVKKKRLLSTVAAVTVALTTSMSAFAYTSPTAVFFGENVYRTHQNSQIANSSNYPWTMVGFLKGQGGLSTPMGDTGGTGILVNPSSLNNTLYFYDTKSWSYKGGGLYKPKLIATVPMSSLGLSPAPTIYNSSPIYVPSTGDVYLAAKDWFLEFNSQGQLINHVSINFANPAQGVPTFTNTPPVPESLLESVSYPLYTTKQQLDPLGLNPKVSDTIWVSSQNGILYAIDPTDLHIIYAENLRTRLDASPSLVTADNGQTFIAVTGASSPNNFANGVLGQGSGDIFLVNPLNWHVTTFANYKSSIGSVSAAIGAAQSSTSGTILWSNVSGDVFKGHITADTNGNAVLESFEGSFSPYNGQDVADNSESAFNAQQAHEYIIPFTTGGESGVGVYSTKTGQYEIVGRGSLYPAGTEELDSDGDIYLADKSGNMDEISLISAPSGSQAAQFSDSSQTYWNEPASINKLFSLGVNSLGLDTPSLLYLTNPWDTETPFLALDTSQGMTLWTDVGENLYFGDSYTSTSSSSFSSPLTLSVKSSDLPTMSSNSDTIQFEMQVNGGSWYQMPSDAWYTYASGVPKTSSYQLSTSQLNAALSAYKSAYGVWSNNGTNIVKIEAYDGGGDHFNYTFTGQNPVTPDAGKAATVTITFPAPTQAPTPSSGLVVPQWMLSMYYPHIVKTANQSIFNLTLPSISGIWPSLSPSGLWDFNLISPDQSTLPKWFYSTKAVMNNGDTNIKNVTLSQLTNTFKEDGNALFVKDNSTTFRHSLLASWLSGNTTAYTPNLVGVTNKNSLGSKSVVNVSVPESYNINSGTTFEYTVWDEACDKYGCWWYPVTAPATEKDTKVTYNVGVTMDQYIPKPSPSANTFPAVSNPLLVGSSAALNLSYYETPSTTPLTIDPEVPMFADTATGNPEVVVSAGQRLRKINPVSYSTIQFERAIPAGNPTPWVPTLLPPQPQVPEQLAQGRTITSAQAANMMEDPGLNGQDTVQRRVTASGVFYKGGSIIGNVGLRGQIVISTFALDIPNSTLKSTWGDSSYSAKTINQNFLNRAGYTTAYGTPELRDLEVRDGYHLINNFTGGSSPYYANEYRLTDAAKLDTTNETDYKLIVRGGQLVSVDYKGKYVAPANIPSHAMQDVLERMHLWSPSGGSTIFNTFEHGTGDNLTSYPGNTTLPSLGNTFTGTSQYAWGKPWYNEGTTQLEIREFTSVFWEPVQGFESVLPLTIPGVNLQESTNGTNGAFSGSYSVAGGGNLNEYPLTTAAQGSLTYRLIMNGNFSDGGLGGNGQFPSMFYDGSAPNPFGGANYVSFLVGNQTIYNSISG